MEDHKDSSGTESSDNSEDQSTAYEKWLEEGEREMSAEWKKQTFRSLQEFWENNDYKPGSSRYEVLALTARYGDIQYMLGRDRIWPPRVSAWSHKFRAALREVLSRLPQKMFDKVENEVGFVLEEPSTKMLAVNAYHPPLVDPTAESGTFTIVIFRSCMDLAQEALIGLIAHEIAHSFVCGKNYREDEKLVDDKAREWGFGPELECLEREKKRLYPDESGVPPATGQPG
jgi:hypothetical protein